MDDFGDWVMAGLYEFLIFVIEIKIKILDAMIWLLDNVATPVVSFVVRVRDR